MKAIFITFLLITFVQAQHVPEDKETLILAGRAQDHQAEATGNVTIPISTERSGSNVKLKEFVDHAELKELTEEPGESSTLITPVPKPVSRENNTETNEENLEIPTTQPESSQHPIHKELNPSVGALDSSKGESYDSKLSVPKKGADPKDEILSVPKKGADPKDEILSVPKKGADPKDDPDPHPIEIKPSVPKKGADPKDVKSSVVPKKGVEPLQPKDKVLESTDDNSESKKPVDSDDERKSVPRKGADPSVFSESSSTVAYVGTDVPRLISTRKEGDTFNKTGITPVVPTASTRKKFVPTLDEASMVFGEASTKPYVTGGSSVIPTTKSDTTTAKSKGSDPAEIVAESITSTEGTSATNSKPTAATDTKGKGDEENISYTPAVVGVVLLVVIFITVIVVGYRRLQDVWMRRHYARMDFLIDGMYDV